MDPIKKQILLVEDEEAIAAIYKQELDKAGYQTDTFPTGGQALEAVQKKSYDVILLDIMLPDTNGVELLKKIKSMATTKNARILMVSNLGQESIMKDSLMAGADGYIIKATITPDKLAAEVDVILS